MTAPRLAIIIPVFRHSVLMADAVDSALAQDLPFPYRILIVNDGCPHPETDEIGRAFARAHPDRVIYLKKQNGGLSSARNHGIAHVLAHLPSVRALYMLDADNRLRPQSMARAMAALDAHPQAGWIYPDIDMIGLDSGHDYSGPHSVLLHTAINTCEAGSLIRREVFEAGVMFDTSFKAGFEDWDFFLSAIEAGFQGRNVEGFGFLYRKRPESMLADSERERGPILARLRAKHRALFSPRHLQHLEQVEAPRYAFVLADMGEVWLTTDPLATEAPTAPEVISPAIFAERLWQGRAAPGRVALPPLVVVTTSEALSELAAAGMLHGILWQLEAIADQAHLAGVAAVRGAPDRMGMKLVARASLRPEDLGLVLLTTDLVAAAAEDPEPGWMGSLLTPQPQPRLMTARVSLPPDLGLEAMGRGGAIAALLDFLAGLRASAWKPGALAVREWREADLRRRGASHMILRNRLGGQPVLPFWRGAGRHIGLVLSLVEFGGVEKVALNLARSFQARGWSVHLFVLGQRDGAVDADWRAALTTVTFLADTEFTPWGGGERSYFGTEVPRWAGAGNHARLIALLHWLDVVIDLHSGAAVAVMGQLKKQGVVTVTSLHLADLSPMGRPTGNPFLSLAYEHAFDIFAPCSHTLGDWLHAMGIPEDKITPVPNAPAFDLAPGQLADLLAARRPGGRLKALFLGRLDAQKGLERLAEVIARSTSLPVDWRVIGKAVLADGALPEGVARVHEPAVSSPQALTEALAWADVLVLLSDYEGLPLTVLEAMRQGVVPLATDVGAVSEVVRDGQTGCLLPLDRAVPACLAALARLAGDPAALARLSQGAAAVMAGRSWLAASDPLVRAIEAVLAKRLPMADVDVPPPDHAPLNPAELERVDLTPPAWTALRAGPSGPLGDLAPYEAHADLIQCGAPSDSGVRMALWAHPLPETGGNALSLRPEALSAPRWFTYELILPAPGDFALLEWQVRIALPRPRNLYVQFMLDGEQTLTLDHGTIRREDIGLPLTLPLALSRIDPGVRASLRRIRLILSTDGELVPLDLLDLAVTGLR